MTLDTYIRTDRVFVVCIVVAWALYGVAALVLA